MARQTSVHEYGTQPMVVIACPVLRNLTKAECGARATASGGVVTTTTYRAQDGYRAVKRQRFRCVDRHEFIAQWTEHVRAADVMP